MHFEPKGDPREIEPLFRRFVSITTWKPWAARFSALDQRVRDNPFLEKYFTERYPLELEMRRLHSRIRRGTKINLPQTYAESAILSFVAIVAEVHHRLSTQGKRRLAGMLRSGLHQEDGLAPLQHEMGVAVHLMSRGFDVDFTDIETGGGCDMVAEKEGAELEVECKTFSGDLGRKIHLRRLFQLAGHVRSLVEEALNIRPGGQLALITLSGRLQGNDQQLRDIHECLAAVLRDGRSYTGGGPCKIEYRQFSLTGSPFETTEPTALNREVVRDYVEREVGLPIRHVVMLFRPAQGAVFIAVESERQDKMMDALVRTLKKSVKRQLTGTRPGLICVQFSDITEQDLLEVAEQDKSGRPSALQIGSSYLLSRDDWKQIHSLAYMTPGHLVLSRAANIQNVTRWAQGQSQAYIFRNTQHEMADDARLRVF